ncbi:MAG: glutamate racemase [Candidatus Margulisiibacteriota bacterium]
MSEVSLISKVITEKVTTKIGEKKEEKKVTPSSPLGIFDSGVGGLTVLSEIMKQLPNEDVVYLADTARVPYGSRPPQEIIKINEEIIPFLIENWGVKLIIMACGTSSSIAYPVLKDKYKVHIIGLIEPGARAAVAATRFGTIGVMATVGTINSHSFPNAITSLKKDAKVVEQACPLLVPLIEGGFLETDEAKKVVKEYLRPLLKEKIDTIILGCTHYPHLIKILREKTGPEVTFIDPAEEAVKEAKELLKKAGTLKGKTHIPKYEFLVTGSVSQFQELGTRLLGKPITQVKLVNLSAK